MPHDYILSSVFNDIIIIILLFLSSGSTFFI